MTLTPNQLKHIRLHPEREGWVRRTVIREIEPAEAGQRLPRFTKPICTHRGVQKSKGGCGGGCKVWECAIHSLCSSAPRAGIVQCPCDQYQAPLDTAAVTE